MTIEFQDVIEGWQRDAENGGHYIHPLPVDSAEWWALGEAQAAQVADYAEAGDLVIDFGCGFGRLSIPLEQAGYIVLAVDASQAMLDGLAERAAAAGTPGLIDDLVAAVRRADLDTSRGAEAPEQPGEAAPLIPDIPLFVVEGDAP